MFMAPAPWFHSEARLPIYDQILTHKINKPEIHGSNLKSLKKSRSFSLRCGTDLMSVFRRDGVFIFNLSLKQIQARALSELVEITVNAYGESHPELQISAHSLQNWAVCEQRQGSPQLLQPCFSQFLFLCLLN